MLRKIIKVISVLSIFVFSNSTFSQVRRGVGAFEIYAQSFSHTSQIANSLQSLSDSVNLLNVISNQSFENEFNQILQSLKKKKAKKRGYVISPRIMVVFKYSDGSHGYIAGNKFTYFHYDNKVYRDKCYKLYELLNKYLDIYDLEEFLESKKKKKRCIAKPN